MICRECTQKLGITKHLLGDELMLFVMGCHCARWCCAFGHVVCRSLGDLLQKQRVEWVPYSAYVASQPQQLEWKKFDVCGNVLGY